MKLLDNTHCFVIVGESKVRIIRGPLALSEACDKVARLRLMGDRYQIMEPQFCENGCCILENQVDYLDPQFIDKTCRHEGTRLA